MQVGSCDTIMGRNASVQITEFCRKVGEIILKYIKTRIETQVHKEHPRPQQMAVTRTGNLWLHNPSCDLNTTRENFGAENLRRVCANG